MLNHVVFDTKMTKFSYKTGEIAQIRPHLSFLGHIKPYLLFLGHIFNLIMGICHREVIAEFSSKLANFFALYMLSDLA